jgi:glutamate racemase
MSGASASIGVFDSGVGGLSVVASIRSLLPAESLLYVADSAHCPYGDKDAGVLRERALAIAEFLIGNGCKAIVVACNTATLATVAMLRERFAIPVVGIEPAVKPAAAVTRSGVIGVLATAATLRSSQYAELCDRYASGISVLQEACPGWVEAVEQSFLDGPEINALVERHVGPLLARGADTLVLGCTHYAFLRTPIERIAGPNVAVLDTSDPVARELRRRLEKHGIMNVAETSAPRHRFFTSGDPRLVDVFVRRVWPAIARIESLQR